MIRFRYPTGIHLYTTGRIAGFLAATIAWGRRDLIVRSSNILLEAMDNLPYEFVISADNSDLKRFSRFVYGTFNGTDCTYFFKGLKHIYSHFGSMEEITLQGIGVDGRLKDGISHLRKIFFEEDHLKRTEKHFADITKGDAGKRINMFLRIIKVA